MASYDTHRQLVKNDDYFTPFSAWNNIKDFIPRDKIIWEAFYNEKSKSPQHLTDLGHRVISEDVDFFTHNYGDIVLSNPPFSICKEVLTRLVLELDKPFILILPSAKMATQYFQSIFKGKEEHLQLIIPSKRIQFNDKNDKPTKQCSFDTFYYCYKMNLPKPINFI